MIYKACYMHLSFKYSNLTEICLHRCLALVIYASAHEFWIFLVAFLHWMCMFLWLAIPKTTFQKERVPRSTKLFW